MTDNFVLLFAKLALKQEILWTFVWLISFYRVQLKYPNTDSFLAKIVQMLIGLLVQMNSENDMNNENI